AGDGRWRDPGQRRQAPGVRLRAGSRRHGDAAMIRLLIVAALAALPLTPATAGETVAIVHARAHTVAGPVVEDATVVIRDGRIVSVEAAGAVPGDARIMDARQRSLTPALFHPATQLGLSDVGAGEEGVASGKSRAGYEMAFAVDG